MGDVSVPGLIWGAFGAVALAVLYVISRYSFLLFQALAELFSIVVARNGKGAEIWKFNF